MRCPTPSSPEVVWVTRGQGAPYTVQEGDPLPQRELLYRLANSLVAEGQVGGRGATNPQEGEEARRGFASFRHLPGAEVVGLKEQEGQVVVQLSGGGEEVVEHLVAMVGYRPDTSITRELQVVAGVSTMPPSRCTTATPLRAP